FDVVRELLRLVEGVRASERTGDLVVLGAELIERGDDLRERQGSERLLLHLLGDLDLALRAELALTESAAFRDELLVLSLKLRELVVAGLFEFKLGKLGLRFFKHGFLRLPFLLLRLELLAL